MRKRTVFLAAVAALVTLASVAPAQPDDGATVGDDAPPTSVEEVIPDQYIVTLRPDANLDRVLRWWQERAGAEAMFVFRDALYGFAIRIPDRWADELANDNRIATVVQDTVVGVTAQSVPTGVSRVSGPISSTLAGNGSGAVDVDIAIIDTGIAPQADLNVVGGRACNGSNTNDGNGHGTHVAGTAAARDDANAVVGVAPGARLWAVKVLGSNGSGSTSQVICGIDWVTANASTIEVANMSLGSRGSEGHCNDGGMHQAICRAVSAGVTFVVAAGNDGRNARRQVPASYDEVITVSALSDFNGAPGGGAASTCYRDVDDTLANYSNWGPDIDLIAPGTCILSTWTSGLRTISGTSMAAPHVAGAAGLYKSLNPLATPAQVRSALIAAGSTNWTHTSEDNDGIKERLLNVASL